MCNTLREQKTEFAQRGKSKRQRLARTAKDIIGNQKVKGIDPCKLVKNSVSMRKKSDSRTGPGLRPLFFEEFKRKKK